MPINSIEQERSRILSVVCPYCKAAPTALCTERYFNAGGTGLRFTNIFHVERIVKAQTVAERARDFTDRLRERLNTEQQAKELKKKLDTAPIDSIESEIG